MIIFRFSALLVVGMLAACSDDRSSNDAEISALEARVERLEGALKENSAKDDPVFNIIKGEMANSRKPIEGRLSDPLVGDQRLQILRDIETEDRLKRVENEQWRQSLEQK